jgi:hypothetical protein
MTWCTSGGIKKVMDWLVPSWRSRMAAGSIRACQLQFKTRTWK